VFVELSDVACTAYIDSRPLLGGVHQRLPIICNPRYESLQFLLLLAVRILLVTGLPSLCCVVYVYDLRARAFEVAKL
jgi:hypothetical protein